MRKEKELRDPVNFQKIISIFLLGFFIYSTVAISLLLLEKNEIRTFQDFVLIVLPLPGFIFALIYLIDKDERIKMDNIEVLEELKIVKELYDSRKQAEGFLK